MMNNGVEFRILSGDSSTKRIAIAISCTGEDQNALQGLSVYGSFPYMQGADHDFDHSE
jgi:hypothetical protein